MSSSPLPERSVFVCTLQNQQTPKHLLFTLGRALSCPVLSAVMNGLEDERSALDVDKTQGTSSSCPALTPGRVPSESPACLWPGRCDQEPSGLWYIDQSLQ